MEHSQTLVLRYRHPPDRETDNIRGQSKKASPTPLAQLQVSAPIGILARLSGAKVDSLTLAIGRHLFGIFQLGEQGNARVADALSKLDSFPSFQSILWFGFGLKHVVHILADTAQGATCVALCACLAEVHALERSAQIVDILASIVMQDADIELRPSMNQWIQLIKSCHGIFARSSFSLLAERLMSLADSSMEPRVGHELVGDEGSPTVMPAAARRSGSIKALAEVLIELSKVTTGKLRTITIIGGAECGFVLALADWLFGLSTAVTLASTGEVLNKSRCPDASDAQVLWILSYPEEISGLQTQIIARSYIIPNGDDIFFVGKAEYIHLAGRVPWDSLIAHCFGEKGRRLLAMPTVLGTALGTAARIFTAAAKGDTAVSQGNRRLYGFYHDASHGIGFVNTAVSTLPELKPMRSTMDLAIQGTFKQAAEGYIEAMNRISMACGCEVCCQEALDELDVDTYDDLGIEPFCLTFLAAVIVRLVQCISCVDVAPSQQDALCPSRLGIELFYLSYRELGRMVDRSIDRLFGDSANANMLYEAALVYGGRHFSDKSPHNTSAIVNSGLCFFYAIMNGLTDDPALARRVTVVPGCIGSGIRTYDSVIDWKRSMPTYPATKVATETIPPAVLDAASQDISASIVVAENFNTVALSWRLSCQKGECWIGPISLMVRLIRVYEFWPKPGHKWCSEDKGLESFTVVEGEGAFDDVKGLKIRLVKGSVLARCMAIANNSDAVVLLKENACLSCCLAWAKTELKSRSDHLESMEIIC